MTILQHSNDCEVTASDSDVKGEDTNKSEDKKSAPAYTKGDLVIYEKGDTRCLVNVVGVDTMDLEPFYTVKGILCDGGTIEKQTIEKYLKCFSTSPSINSEVKDAEIMKAMGDQSIGEQKFSMAATNYSSAIEILSEGLNLHKIMSNRSYANLKCNRYNDALYDAECTIALMPSWPKGYYRKAMAQQKLCPEEAVLTIRDAIVMFPDNEEIRAALGPVTREAKKSLFSNEVSSKKEAVEEAKRPMPLVLQELCSWLKTQPNNEVPATDLGQFYRLHPDLKHKIGKLASFCEKNSDYLVFERRGKKQFVRLKIN